jgi:hypothetical protein
MENNQPDVEEPLRFRAETEELMGIEKQKKHKPQVSSQGSEKSDQKSEDSPEGAAENSQGRKPLEGEQTNDSKP